MRDTKQSSLMIILLWCLTFSKCLTLEYLIQVYSVPINSFFYIWSLTLTLASVATFVFFRTKTAKSKYFEEISIVHLIWLACTMIGIVSVGVFFLLGGFDVNILTTILSVTLGAGYLVHGVVIGKNILIFNGIGWWIGAAMLATQNSLESLAIFASLIILLTILPTMVEMRQQRIGFF